MSSNCDIDGISLSNEVGISGGDYTFIKGNYTFELNICRPRGGGRDPNGSICAPCRINNSDPSLPTDEREQDLGIQAGSRVVPISVPVQPNNGWTAQYRLPYPDGSISDGISSEVDIFCHHDFPSPGRLVGVDESDDGLKYSFRVESSCGLPSPTIRVKDLYIRFAKLGSITDTPEIVNYPISADDAEYLRSKTDAISVIHPSDCLNCEKNRATHIEIVQNVLGGLPSYPSSSPNGHYWTMLSEVVDRQEDRRTIGTNNAARIMPMPNIWNGDSILKVAENVHDEIPGIHHMALLSELVGGGALTDRTVLPSPSRQAFLRGAVALSDLNGKIIANVGPTNFQTKWAAGRARPEEVAWKISTGELTAGDGVPEDLITRIQDMKLPNQFAFTAYDEGSPTHPSWPAMHSAASSGSLWIPTVMDLTEDQLCQTRLVDWAIAYARTIAGVHHPDENIAGLKLGYHIVSQFLPDYLAETYGADRFVVREKMNRISANFSWDDFLDSDCAKNAML